MKRVIFPEAVRKRRGGQSRTKPGLPLFPWPARDAAIQCERTKRRQFSLAEAMDGVDLLSATGILHQPIREAPASAGGNETNTPVWQNDSKGGAAACFKMLIRLSGEVIKLAGGDVSLDLLVPRVRHELLEPSVKGSQVRLRQSPHLHFQFLNAHGLSLVQTTPGSKFANCRTAYHDRASEKVKRGLTAAGPGLVPPPRRPNITGRDARRTRRRRRPRYFVNRPAYHDVAELITPLSHTSCPRPRLPIRLPNRLAAPMFSCDYFASVERWQSGLTRTPGKRECPKSTGGSNPPLSAKFLLRISPAFDVKQAGVLFQPAQDGENNEAGDEQAKPRVIQMEISFHDRVPDQVKQKKHRDDQEERVVFALRHGAPAKWDRRRLPAMPSRKEGGSRGAPFFKAVAEALAQKAPAQVVEFEQGGEKNGDECQRKVAAMAEKPGTRLTIDDIAFGGEGRRTGG
jgi:hypothetical protein